MSATFAQTLDHLEAVLDRENAALTSARFGELDTIKQDKLTASAALDRFQNGLALDQESREQAEIRLARIRDLVARNSGLLQAALHGARSAQDRLNGLTRQDQQVGAYDQAGRPVSLAQASVYRKFKV